MTQPGLAQVSPALVEMLRQSTDNTRHQLVERVCLLAVQRADVADPDLAEALDAIHSRSFGSGRFALDGSLAASFDSLYEAYYAIDNQDDFLRSVADSPVG